MRNIRAYIAVVLGLVFLSLLTTIRASADQIYAPPVLWDKGISNKTGPIEIADTHLGIPYRDDGTIDSRGYFTTFDNPEKFFDTPGLNCSGLVLSVSRFVFNKNWTLEEVTRDRQNNSGDGSQMGKDWDFGWDLIMNISEGRSPRFIMPEGPRPVEGTDGLMRGFDLHDADAWTKVISQMQPDRVYLASISRTANDKGYRLLHYHVVIMLPSANGGVWLYHSTRRSSVHKMNINSPQGMSRFMSQFKGGEKKILIVEAALQSETGAEIASESESTPNPPSSEQKLQTDNADISAGAEPPARPISQNQPQTPEPVITHLAGKVFKSFPELQTHIPTFAGDDKRRVRFLFVNRGNSERNVQISLRSPEGDSTFTGKISPQTGDVQVMYPDDFKPSHSLKYGEYLAEVSVDGSQWCANLFEVGLPREAQPKIIDVKVPTTVQAGKTFTLRIDAQNQGAESDYGGITVSCPDTSGLKIVSAKPGKVFGTGSMVLSVTTDKIKTKVPMAERWIELWGENKTYDMTVQLQAGQPGTYPIYVRCALRGVNVKSSVVLMDPAQSQVVDQQGFPVNVINVNVK